MENLSVKPPLSNLQAELLKLFSMNLPEEVLIDLKKVIAVFLLERARDKADAIWDEKRFNSDWLNQIQG
ncbi:MAG: hypothetical protein H3C39_06265 [Flavobacteriia bacterium]|nr:hypothetical protein [Flavobacteriia bacterium]